MKQFCKYILLAFFISSVSIATASDVSERPARGWHWYDLEPEIVEAIKEEIDRQVEVKVSEAMKEKQPPQPKVGSTAWISENLPKFRARAGDNPTSDNIRALLYLEKMLTDRAATLAYRAVMIAQTDPFLDTSYKPTSNMHYARATKDGMREKQAELVNRLISDGLVIWSFIEPNCSTCEQQARVLSSLTRRYALPVLFILMDGAQAPVYVHEENTGLWESIVDNGHSDLFPLLTTPTSYAFDTKSGEYILVSQGYATSDMFIDRVVSAADYAGWATPQEIEATKFRNEIVNLGLFDFSNTDEDMTDAPTFLKYVESVLEGESND